MHWEKKIQKAQAVKGKIEMRLLKKICKYSTKRRDRIGESYATNKDLKCRIYKEVKKLNTNKTTGQKS